MADNNNKNPNEKQPGEKPDGTYHFNPGRVASSNNPHHGELFMAERYTVSLRPVHCGKDPLRGPLLDRMYGVATACLQSLGE